MQEIGLYVITHICVTEGSRHLEIASWHKVDFDLDLKGS